MVWVLMIYISMLAINCCELTTLSSYSFGIAVHSKSVEINLTVKEKALSYTFYGCALRLSCLTLRRMMHNIYFLGPWLSLSEK